jgi:hypothetical protein
MACVLDSYRFQMLMYLTHMTHIDLRWLIYLTHIDLKLGVAIMGVTAVEVAAMGVAENSRK